MKNSRLDFLYGLDAGHDSGNVFSNILEQADRFYDLIFVDVHCDMEGEAAEKLLQKADIVVTVINQNLFVMQQLLDDSRIRSMFESLKKCILCVNRYEASSRYTLRRIHKILGRKDLMALPQSYAFRDACNDGTLIDFILRNMETRREDMNFEFMHTLKGGVQKLIGSLDEGDRNDH